MHEDKSTKIAAVESTAAIDLGRSRIVKMAGFIFAWIPYALLVYRFRWVCDDAFISFRYARNLAMGNGLRYNLGDHVPVEGYSNFLWVIICSVFEYLKADITIWPLLLSFGCGSILLYLVYITLQRRLGLNLLLCCIVTMFLGCSPSFAIWSTGGLETAAFALLLFVTFERLVFRPKSIAPITAGIAGLALVLLRVEGIYWAVLLAAIAIFSRWLASEKIVRQILIYLGIVLLGYAIYWASRYAYYRLPFANSAYVKVNVSTAALQRGLYYVIVQFLSLLTPFVIFPGLVMVLVRKRFSLGLAVVMIPIITAGYTIVVSGDFMGMGRLLVPALAFNTLLFGWLLGDIWNQSLHRKVLATALGMLVVAIGALPGWDIDLVPESLRARFDVRKPFVKRYISEYGIWESEKKNALRWAEKGKFLKNYAKPGDTLVQGGIGAVGYYSELFIYDRFGLVTRSVALRKSEGDSLLMAGHDKRVPPTFFISEKPTILWAHEATPRKLHLVVSQLANSSIAGEYIVDFTKMSTKSDEGGPLYLFIFRRLEKGADAEAAWRKVYASLARVPES
jgi:arabinofuranosyltransferase